MVLRALRGMHAVRQPGNVSETERWLSLLAGLGLTLLAVSRHGALRRTALSTAGLTLLTRGATGYCAVKGAYRGDTTFKEGLREQWNRIRASMRGSAAASIDSMDALYVAELQELHSAESQLVLLLEDLEGVLDNAALKARLSSYANEVRTRLRDLSLLLESFRAPPNEHPDQAMQALIAETWKMAQVCAPAVRSSALVASLQRLIHYKIATYGTVAAYAKVLGQSEEATRFAEHAERDRIVDAELSDLAKASLNPQASVDPGRRGEAEARPH
jgi:ferritin-like metal-binding protein YciE